VNSVDVKDKQSFIDPLMAPVVLHLLKFNSKLRMRKGRDCNYDKWNIPIDIVISDTDIFVKGNQTMEVNVKLTK
jgi:hypothetical protein